MNDNLISFYRPEVLSLVRLFSHCNVRWAVTTIILLAITFIELRETERDSVPQGYKYIQGCTETLCHHLAPQTILLFIK